MFVFTAQGVRNDVAAARADNVALVERLHYVGGYRQQQVSRRSATATDLEAGTSGADAEGRYSKMYEDGINPFKEFQVHAVCCFPALAACIMQAYTHLAWHLIDITGVCVRHAHLGSIWPG